MFKELYQTIKENFKEHTPYYFIASALLAPFVSQWYFVFILVWALFIVSGINLFPYFLDRKMKLFDFDHLWKFLVFFLTNTTVLLFFGPDSIREYLRSNIGVINIIGISLAIILLSLGVKYKVGDKVDKIFEKRSLLVQIPFYVFWIPVAFLPTVVSLYGIFFLVGLDIWMLFSVYWPSL